jgi:hypothetical protein
MSDKLEHIVVNITGDFCPGNLLNLSESSSLEDSGGLIEIFQSADINITNLECPLTDSNDKIPKSGPHIKAVPESVSLLKKMGINFVTLANNHIMDYGTKGLNDTINILSENKVKFCGVGGNINETQKQTYLEIKGKKVAIINFAAHEFSIAGSEKAGANPVDVIDNYSQIIEAKASSDFQIVIVHMGIEHYAYPTPAMQKLFRFYATLGVNAVVAHHSHCVSGYEVFKGVPIFYGLGNFVFEGKDIHPTWHEGLALQLFFTPSDRIDYKTFLFVQKVNKGQLYLKLVNAELPEELTSDIISKKWEEHLNKTQKRRNMLNHLQKRGFFSRALNRLFPVLAEKGLNYAYLNLLRNESNYEFLIDVLEDIVEDV